MITFSAIFIVAPRRTCKVLQQNNITHISVKVTYIHAYIRAEILQSAGPLKQMINLEKLHEVQGVFFHRLL